MFLWQLSCFKVVTTRFGSCLLLANKHTATAPLPAYSKCIYYVLSSYNTCRQTEMAPLFVCKLSERQHIVLMRIAFCLCAVPVPGPRVFRRCLAAETISPPFFTTNYCPCNQVIRIRSAEVGINPGCWQNVECTWSVTNHTEVMNCNGERSCNISQNVLDYSPLDKLCDSHQNGNSITITYDCLNGT